MEAWTDAKTKPSVNSQFFATGLLLRVDGKEKKGYYDAFLEQYFCEAKYDMHESCKPTHWRKQKP